MATLTQVQNYISSMRVGVSDYVDSVCLKERLGRTDTFCNRQKVMLLSAYMNCVVDYFTPFLNGATTYDAENFFTTDEIMDCMQHINNICGTFYTIEL
jgi:hypothetical protein